MVNPILQFFLWNGWFLKYYLCVIKDLQKNQLHSGTCKHLQFHHNWDAGVFLRKMSGEASTLPLLRLFLSPSLSLSSRSRVVQLARILRSSFTSGLWLIFLLAALSLSLSLSLYVFHPALGDALHFVAMCRHIRRHQESISQMRKTCSSIHINSLTPPQKEDFSNGILNFIIYYSSHFFIYIINVMKEIGEVGNNYAIQQLVLRFPGNINHTVKRLWHFPLAIRFPARTSILRELNSSASFAVYVDQA